MFSLQLHIPLSSPLGQRVPLIQHLIVVGIVNGILSIDGYEVSQFLYLFFIYLKDLYMNLFMPFSVKYFWYVRLSLDFEMGSATHIFFCHVVSPELFAENSLRV